MTTSFPFLKIAREHGVPYGAVIRLAEKCWESPAPTIVLYNPILFDVWDAVRAEQERRRLNTPQTVAWSDSGDYRSWKAAP
jgi:hypothetical protein